METLLGDFEKQEVKMLGGKYLVFTLEKRSYGISILSVNEIIGLLDITPIPKLPTYVKGVINLRGAIIPVIDLRLKLEMQEKEYDERTCIIIVNSNEEQNEQVGLIVDMVSEVFDIPNSDIEPSLKYNATNNAFFLEGIGKINDQAIMLLRVSSIIE